MDERVIHLRVGAVVICAVLITGSLFLLFGEGWKSQYTVLVDTKTAPSVSKGTPVRKNGILIGRVADVETRERGVLLTLKINSDDKIYDDEFIQIGTSSFLGDPVLEVLPSDDEVRGDPISSGHVFASSDNNVRIKPDPMAAINMFVDMQAGVNDLVNQWKATGRSIDNAAISISGVGDEIRNAFGNEQSDIKVILENTRNLTEKADIAMGNINEIFGGDDSLLSDPDYRRKLRDSFEQIPDMIVEIRAAVDDTRTTVNGFREVSAGLESNLDNLDKFTGALGADGPEILSKLNQTMDGVDEFVTNMNRITGSFSVNSSGSFGKFLNDPSLYNNFNSALKNIQEITIKLQPLIDDARVIGDGLAREGLRGIVRPSALNSGSKPSSIGAPSRSPNWSQW